MILVTGASGNVGRQVVLQLLEAGNPVRALSRNPAAANLPPLVEVFRGDLNDAGTLDACLKDVDAVFLVWTASFAAAPAAINRIAKYAKRLVLLTSPHNVAHPLFQQPNPLAAQHAELERLVRASGLKWTFLRPGMFASNALAWWAPQIRIGDRVRWPYAEAPSAPIDERDIATVALRALTQPGHAGADYVLTGPESLTQSEQVMVIAEALGRQLHFEELLPETARREWKAPQAAVDMLLNAWAAALGQPAYVTSTVAELTGKPARSFHEWVLHRAADFRC